MVLSQKAKDSLPGYLKLVMHRFEVQKVWVPGEPITLPPASPSGMHYTPEDQPEYVAYCRSMLDQGKVDQGIAKSMMVGLRVCGKAGKELSETIKRKILRK